VFTRRSEGCEADDKKLTNVSTRKLKSEDVYLGLCEFAFREPLRVYAVLSRSATLHMLHFILRSMRFSLQRQRRQLPKLLVSDHQLRCSYSLKRFWEYSILQCTSRLIRSVRPFGELRNFPLHASPASNDLTHQKYGTQTTLKSTPRGVQFYIGRWNASINIYSLLWQFDWQIVYCGRLCGARRPPPGC